MAKQKKSKLPRGARKGRRAMTKAQEKPAVGDSAAVETLAQAASVEAAAVTTEVSAPPVETPAESVEAPSAPEKAKAKRAPRAAKAKKAAETKTAESAETPKERKKPGPKPKTPEQKAEAQKQRKALKADTSNGATTVYIQYKGMEDGVEDLLAAAKADYRATHKRTPINSIKLYIKPEEYAAYYVVNDSYFGKVNM